MISRELESTIEWTEFVFHLLIKNECEIYFNVANNMDQTKMGFK